MYTRTVTIENNQVVALNGALREMSVFMGGVGYEITERIELTITTESERLASVIEQLLEIPKAQTPEAMVVNTAPPELVVVNSVCPPPVEVHSVVTLPAGIAASRVEPAPGGLVACNVVERSAICECCQKPFIRSRKGQTHCNKPECIKAKQAEYSRKYLAKKKAEKELEVA